MTLQICASSNPTRDAELKRRHSAAYLNALLAGKAVTIGECTYRLFRKGDEFQTTFGLMAAGRTLIARRAILNRSGLETEIWMATEIELAKFIDLAEAESIEAAFVVGAETVLMQEAQRRRHLA